LEQIAARMLRSRIGARGVERVSWRRRTAEGSSVARLD